MIPTLNMTKIHRNNTPVSMGSGGGLGGGQGSVSRPQTGRQVSPRTSTAISPRDTSSSQPSGHLTRRAADVAAVLEMNPLQCQNVAELQRRLIETAEWVTKLRHWYLVQLHERDQWLEGRVRELERYYSDAVTTAAAASGSSVNASAVTAPNEDAYEGEKGNRTPPRRRRDKQQRVGDPVGANPASPNGKPQAPASDPRDGSANTIEDSPNRVRTRPPKRSAVVPITQGRRSVSANAVRRPQARPDDTGFPRMGSTVLSAVDRGDTRPTPAARAAAGKEGVDDTPASTGGHRYALNLSGSRGGSATPAALPPLEEIIRTRKEAFAALAPLSSGRAGGTNTALESSGPSAVTGGGSGQRKTETNSARKRSYTSSPRAGAMGPKVPNPLASSAGHFYYLEAGAGLARDSTVTSREGNGLSSTVESLTEPPQGHGPRDSRSHVYLLSGSAKSSSGRRGGRSYTTAGRAKSSTRHNTSRGLSEQAPRKSTSSGEASRNTSPDRTRGV